MWLVHQLVRDVVQVQLVLLVNRDLNFNKVRATAWARLLPHLLASRAAQVLTSNRKQALAKSAPQKFPGVQLAHRQQAYVQHV